LLTLFRLETLLYWLSPVALALFLSIVYFTFIERWTYMRLAPASAVEKIYRRLYRLGRPLVGERTKAETAYEFMRKLISGIDATLEHSRFAKLFFTARRDLEYLTGLYQDSLFADQMIVKDDARKALQAWKRLRLRLLVVRLMLRTANRRARRSDTHLPYPGHMTKQHLG
jgi:hypothetical protein